MSELVSVPCPLCGERRDEAVAQENGFTMESDSTGALCFHEPKNEEVATIDAQTGMVLAGPDIVTRGFVYEPVSEDLIAEARARVIDSLEKLAAEGVNDPSIIKQRMRQAASRLFDERTQRRPIIIPTVMEV